jgi:hypothetical protein
MPELYGSPQAQPGTGIDGEAAQVAQQKGNLNVEPFTNLQANLETLRDVQEN